MDFTLYWFMFPVSICVATCAMLSGIGGAALFTPIFILIFPLLGPEYPLSSTLAAIGTALLTETFGFTSGFIGYYRRRMIDFAMGIRFLKLSVPIAILGAIVAHEVHEGLLVGGYALLVLVLAVGILFLHRHTAAVVTVGRSEPTERHTDPPGLRFEGNTAPQVEDTSVPALHRKNRRGYLFTRRVDDRPEPDAVTLP